MKIDSVHNLQNELKTIDSGLKRAFSSIKEEMTDHKDTINDNSAEIELVHQRLNMLQSMIEKLTGRVDELVFSTSSTASSIVEFKAPNVPLSLREQEVFVILYTSTTSLSALAISKYLGLTEDLIHTYIIKLITKDIPIIKSINTQKELIYALDKNFKDLQARKGLIEINESVMNQFNLQTDFVKKTKY